MEINKQAQEPEKKKGRPAKAEKETAATAQAQPAAEPTTDAAPPAGNTPLRSGVIPEGGTIPQPSGKHEVKAGTAYATVKNKKTGITHKLPAKQVARLIAKDPETFTAGE